MEPSGSTVRASIDVPMGPSEAFDVLLEELTEALEGVGFRLEDGPSGRIVHGDFEVGRVVSWEPGEEVVLEWRQASWKPEETTEVTFLFEPAGAGTRMTLEHRGWGRLIEDGTDVVGWFATEVATPIAEATAPDAFGDWLTDRKARRPSGGTARTVYGDPLYHYPNFSVVLDELGLTRDDHLLEVGCGGGALLEEALESGCRAAAVDHSSEMVQLARSVNRDAVDAGRLVVHEASACELPFHDGTFTCATMTGVLGFLPDPVTVLAEMRRVLGEGGRIVIVGSDPELRGTDAVPEPMASRSHFYGSEELTQIAHEAGFGDARVVRHDLESHARDAGVPAEHLSLFHHRQRFLLARKDR